MKVTNLLIVDDDEAMTHVFERLAKDKGWTFEVARNGNEAIKKLAEQRFEAAVVDIMMPGFTGLQVLEYAKQNHIRTELVMVTGVGSVASAVDAIKKGAYDYLTKPFEDIGHVGIMVEKAIERFRLIDRLKRLERQRENREAFEDIIGKSQKIQDVFHMIEAMASSTSTVLVQGESGTGKELVARAIHQHSPRAKGNFVVINCGAIPEHLLESELFGHRKGSFTGAIADRKGLFEEAHQGTIFLDEIGELPLPLQVKLLRVLQEGEIRAVGDSVTKKVDVRLLAATNRDLQQLVKENKFREDLYYRLNVINMVLPSLRDRLDDIPMLAYHFLKKYATKTNKSIEQIGVDAMQALQNYSWPGNVRELENVIERAVVLATNDTISVHDLPPRVLGESFYLVEEGANSDLTNFNYKDAKNRALAAFNRAYIGALLRQSKGNISFASEKAGMDRSNFKKLLKRYGIDSRNYRSQDGGEHG